MVVVQAHFGSVISIQGYFESRKVSVCFADNILQKQNRAMPMVSLCSTGRDASIDMHIDLLQSWSDLSLRDLRTPDSGGQNLPIIRGWQKHVWMRLNERNTVEFELLLWRSLFFVQTLFTKNHIAAWVRWYDLTGEQYIDLRLFKGIIRPF